jgi:hypothetical protein
LEGIVLGPICPGLRAQTPVTEEPEEAQLLKAAKVYFGNDITPAEEKLVCTAGQFLNRPGFALLAEGAKIGGAFAGKTSCNPN